MTDTSATSPTRVRTSITVEAPVERAFAIFTADMGSWWPADHHILDGKVAQMILEPRVGGRIYDLGEDGRECCWARVLAWEPPRRLVFSWDISSSWQVETDPTRASEVEVEFIAEGAGRTRVELEHRHLDRHGDGWEGMRDAVGSPGGWPGNLSRFAAHVAEVNPADAR